MGAFDEDTQWGLKQRVEREAKERGVAREKAYSSAELAELRKYTQREKADREQNKRIERLANIARQRQYAKQRKETKDEERLLERERKKAIRKAERLRIKKAKARKKLIRGLIPTAKSLGIKKKRQGRKLTRKRPIGFI